MAIIDLNAIGELLREEFAEPWIEAVDRDNFLLQRFGRTNMTGGDRVRWKVHYAGHTVASPYSENDELPETGMQAYTQASVPIKQNWKAIEVTGLAQAATQGSAGFVDLVAEETEQALEDLKDQINDQLMATTADGTGRAIYGMPWITSDTGAGYGGIDRTSNSFWRSFVLGNSGTPRPLSIPLMQAVMTEMEKTYRKSKISVILTNRKHFYDYGNMLTPDRRFTATEKLDGGFLAVDFEGIPMVAVPNLPAGAIYFLDESTWSYHVLQDFEVKPKSTNKDSDYFLITHYSNLICKDPRKNAKITDLS